MEDVIAVTIAAQEKKVGFLGMIRRLVLSPRRFFETTIAQDKFPYLFFTAWLAGLAHSLQWMDKLLLKQGGLVSDQYMSFALVIVMSFVFTGVLYSFFGLTFHFYAFLADMRKDLKHSTAVTIYAWMPFAVAVFLTKIVAVLLLREKYLTPPKGWWFQTPSMVLLGLSILYGWFLAVYGAIVGLGCKKLRAVVLLFVVPILWVVLIYLVARALGKG